MEEKEKKKKPTRVVELQAMLIESDKRIIEWMERCQKQEEELNAYRKANNLLEEELVKLRNENETLYKANDNLCKEIQMLGSRNLWDRIINKKEGKE